MSKPFEFDEADLVSDQRRRPCITITKLAREVADGGKTVNGFRITNELGIGGYAVVSEAEYAETGKRFALKKMSKRQLTKKYEFTKSGPLGRPIRITALDKVRREIDLMRWIWSPHIVKMLAVIDDADEDPLFLILELMERGQVMDWENKNRRYVSKLYENNRAGGIVEPDLRTVMQALVDALEYLHAHRVVHRDLKPENLLVHTDGSVKLADFGVARQFKDEESQMVTETHGTYHYFAPEMCTGLPYDAFKAELWSIGVTCFVLATGQLPFMHPDDSMSGLFEMIAEAKFELPLDHGLSVELEQLIRGLLVKEPDQRLNLEQIKQHPWMQGNNTHTS